MHWNKYKAISKPFIPWFNLFLRNPQTYAATLYYDYFLWLWACYLFDVSWEDIFHRIKDFLFEETQPPVLMICILLSGGISLTFSAVFSFFNCYYFENRRSVIDLEGPSISPRSHGGAFCLNFNHSHFPFLITSCLCSTSPVSRSTFIDLRMWACIMQHGYINPQKENNKLSDYWVITSSITFSLSLQFKKELSLCLYVTFFSTLIGSLYYYSALCLTEYSQTCRMCWHSSLHHLS